VYATGVTLATNMLRFSMLHDMFLTFFLRTMYVDRIYVRGIFFTIALFEVILLLMRLNARLNVDIIYI
jgi:hypothetical protein